MKTSIKPLLNIRKDSAGQRYTLVLQVIRLRRRGVIFTPYQLLPEEFDAKRGVAVATSRAKAHKAFIREVNDYISCQVREVERVVAEMDRMRRQYTARDIVHAFRERYNNRYVSTFFRAQIAAKEAEGKHGTATTYRTTLNVFERFAGARRIRFEQIDEGLMMEFEHYLLSVPLQRNTVTFYLRIFRAVYNKARRNGYAPKGATPFEGVSFRIEETRKLAISAATLRKLVELDYRDKSSLSATRNLFLFSFYARGMSFVDMAYLRRSDIYDGGVRYRRQKTGQLFTVRIVPQLQAIIDHYLDFCAPWVLPVMMDALPDGSYRPMVCEADTLQARKEFEVQLYLRYKYARSNYWRYLSRISRDLGLKRNLSFNVARHTWASLARDLDIPVAVISRSLGHTSEKTTHIYLSELNPEKIDQANQLVTQLSVVHAKSKKQKNNLTLNQLPLRQGRMTKSGANMTPKIDILITKESRFHFPMVIGRISQASTLQK